MLPAVSPENNCFCHRVAISILSCVAALAQEPFDSSLFHIDVSGACFDETVEDEMSAAMF